MFHAVKSRLRRWFNNSPKHLPSLRPVSLRLEVLERRDVPAGPPIGATITVNMTGDPDGEPEPLDYQISLREAIMLAEGTLTIAELS